MLRNIQLSSLLLLLITASLCATGQSSSESTVKAPISLTVHDPLTAEDVMLIGMVSVKASLAPDGHGGANGTVGCAADAVRATGKTSGAPYVLNGADSQNAGTAGPLPAAAIIPCTLSLSAKGQAQNVKLSLQVTLNQQGSVANAVVMAASAVNQ